MSRSISTSRNGFRKAISSFSASELASTASRFQRWSKLSAQPNSRATEATDCPSWIFLTASRLNSSSYFLMRLF